MNKALTFASAAAVASLLAAPTAGAEPAAGAPPAPNGLYTYLEWIGQDPATSEQLPPMQVQLQAGPPGTFTLISNYGPHRNLLYEWKNNDTTGDGIGDEQVWFTHRAGGVFDLDCKAGAAKNPPTDIVLRPEGNKLVGFINLNWSPEFPGCPNPETGQVSTDYTKSTNHIELIPA